METAIKDNPSLWETIAIKLTLQADAYSAPSGSIKMTMVCAGKFLTTAKLSIAEGNAQVATKAMFFP